jgi:hypothetical protein
MVFVYVYIKFMIIVLACLQMALSVLETLSTGVSFSDTSPSPVNAPQIGPPYLDTPTERIVEPLNQGHNGALAATRRPDEGDSRALGDAERNIVQNCHVWAGGVGEADGRKLDIGLE